MAKRVKVSRKELLNQPDQFLTTSEKIAVFFDEHRGPLLFSTGVVLAIFLLVGGFKYNQQKKSMRMEKLYFEVEKVHNDKLAKTPKEAIPEMEKLLGEFQDGPQKTRANLLLAGGYFQNGQFDKAIELYQNILDQKDNRNISNQLARAGLAQSYEGKKDYARAIEIYKSIIENPQEFPLFQVYMGLARCYELNQDQNNALLTLREAKNKFQGHPQLDSVESRIRKLSDQA